MVGNLMFISEIVMTHVRSSSLDLIVPRNNNNNNYIYIYIYIYMGPGEA